MTHTLGLSASQQAAGRPTRSTSGRSQRRPSIRACRGQRWTAYITWPREHGLALLRGPFVLTLPYPCLGRSLTDPNNTRALQYQSGHTEHAVGGALTAEDTGLFLDRKGWQTGGENVRKSSNVRKK